MKEEGGVVARPTLEKQAERTGHNGIIKRGKRKESKKLADPRKSPLHDNTLLLPPFVRFYRTWYTWLYISCLS